MTYSNIKYLFFSTIYISGIISECSRARIGYSKKASEYWRRKQLYLILLPCIFFGSSGIQVFAQNYGGATGIYTDYKGFWYSGTAAINHAVKPESSHNLTAFTWRGITYSTGVDDGQLMASGVNFTPAVFQAFPVRNIQSTNSTYIGLGQLHDGVHNGRSNPAPFSVPPKLANFLTDGQQGLDIGTGVANIKAGEVIFEFTGIIDPGQIADGIPDILVSQIADPSSTTDEIFLTDAQGRMVGSPLRIRHNTIDRVGLWTADFYELDGRRTAFTNEDRDLRLYVAELSAFGINQSNYHRVTSMRYKLNGTSDPAFAAYKVGVFDIISANNDEAETQQGEEVRISVLQNDQPLPTLDPGSVSILSGPGNGTLTIDHTHGTVTYRPSREFSGIDTFTYEVCSNQSVSQLCDEAVVQVSVRAIILPIDLLHFSAHCDPQNRVMLTWATATETGSDFFEVQHSKDARDWDSVEKIPGSGHSSAAINYSISDKAPRQGYNYYRLKQVDLDGSFELSEVILVRIDAEIPAGISIYPNPNRGEITVEANPTDLDQLSLVNVFGQVQAERLRIKRISPSMARINLDDLAPGLYVIRAGRLAKTIRKL